MPGPSLEGRCGALWHARPVGFYSGCRISTGFVDATPMREVVGVGAAGTGGESPVLASGRPGAERRAAGALEAEVLAIFRAADGPLTPGEVRQRLGPGTPAGPDQADGQRGELSYSTVVTIV